MFLDGSKGIRIISALELSWTNNKRYAKPRPFHALSFRVYGDTEFEHNGKTHHVSSGDVAFVPKDYGYTQTHKGEHLYVVHFEMDDDSNEDFFSITPRDTIGTQKLFEKIHKIWDEKQIGYQFAATSVFYKLLEELQKDVLTEGILSSSAKMKKVLDYINANYSDPSLSVAQLAEMYGTSDTYFRQEFKKLFDDTPLNYINNIRLTYAEELLHTGYYSVSEVAYKTGFSDPKYFSRFVRKVKNVPPSKLQ